jgi:hypothetical protein
LLIGEGFFLAQRAVVLVPKTAVYEDSFLAAWEDQVGGAGKITSMQTKPIAHGVGDPAHNKFRLRVGTADAAHLLAYLRRRGCSHGMILRDNTLESSHVSQSARRRLAFCSRGMVVMGLLPEVRTVRWSKLSVVASRPTALDPYRTFVGRIERPESTTFSGHSRPGLDALVRADFPHSPAV